MDEYSLPRGMRDIDSDQLDSAEKVRNAFLETSRLFDYKIMEPSSLELLETLEAKSGPAIRNEIYYFKDKSERDLGLRFDLTVGLTRYVASKRELALPIRVGSFASVWRYDEPQYGRYRWFYQWDIELFGPSNAETDAEVIEFSSVLFSKIGTKPRIAIGSRKVIESFVRKELKIVEEGKVLDILRAIDKLSKKSVQEIASEYSNSFSKQDFEKVAAFTASGQKVETLISAYGIGAGSLPAIVDSLKSRGINDVEVNLGITRGIDYYTDMVFEAHDRVNPRLGSLCGGGRYDSLPAVYGRPDLGATGVAGGVERAALAVEKKDEEKSRKGLVFVAPIGEKTDVKKKSIEIASMLRREGFPSQSELSGKSLRKILEAQSSSALAVIMIGERELAARKMKVKWMDSGEENEVSEEDLVRFLRESISA